MVIATATLKGGRGAYWRAVCGTDTFPLRSPAPVSADLIGIGETEVYFIDIDRLTPETFGAIVQHMANNLKTIPYREVEREIRTRGLPLLTVDCSIRLEEQPDPTMVLQ